MANEQARQFLDQATQAIQGGQFADALDLLDRSLALDPSDSEAFVLRGVALAQLQRTEEATQAFRNAISLNPSNPKAFYNLAVHYYALGQKAPALEMARESVRLDANQSSAAELVARIEAETGAGHAQPPAPGNPVSSTGPYGEQVQGQYSTPGQYYRQGYGEQYSRAPLHSVRFVEKMGKSWDILAFLLGVLGVIHTYWVVTVAVPMVMKIMNNPQLAQNRSQIEIMQGQAGPLMTIVAWVAQIGVLVWMIIELTDRRGNWLWMLPTILACCCQIYWLVPIIYIFAGRSKA